MTAGRDEAASSGQKGRSIFFLDIIALGIWVGGIHLTTLLFVVACFGLPSSWAVSILVILLTLSLIPLYKESAFARSVARFICRQAMRYFPVTMIMEDPKAVKAAAPCVIGVEPHSILPYGIVAFASESEITPLPNLCCGATDAIFLVPFARHVWSWLGLVPASKKSLKSILAKGQSVGVVPGGVQECLYMEHGVETLYLQKRKGFVRLAIEEKVPLLPVFIFGQSFMYQWWKPSGKLYNALARRIGFAPLAFWGLLGTPIPLQTPMTVVVGNPIPLPVISKDDPNFNTKVDEVHSAFVSEMERIFHKYKKQAGYENLALKII